MCPCTVQGVQAVVSEKKYFGTSHNTILSFLHEILGNFEVSFCFDTLLPNSHIGEKKCTENTDFDTFKNMLQLFLQLFLAVLGTAKKPRNIAWVYILLFSCVRGTDLCQLPQGAFLVGWEEKERGPSIRFLLLMDLRKGSAKKKNPFSQKKVLPVMLFRPAKTQDR